MKLDQLKQGFFGYQKADVCRYITSLEEDYSRQLSELEDAAKVQATEYESRIHQLEQALRESNLRYEVLKQDQMKISSTLQEAEHYAEVLHKKAEAEELHEQEAWQKQLDAKVRELNRYQGQISSLHDLFHTLLRSMEEQTSALLQQAQSIKDACPDHHMALFERKIDSVSKSQE